MNKIIIIIPLVVIVGILIFPFVAFYGNQVMVITSDSMMPILNTNDVIIVKPSSIEEINEGDIITFDSHMSEFGVIAHRAISIFEEDDSLAIHTKGDNILNPDPWTVHDEDLIGKVIKVIPKMGIVFDGPVRYFLVIIFAVIAIFLFKGSFESKTQK